MGLDPRKRVDTDRAEARREQILRAAATCFRRDGFHGASMVDIAREAGLSAGHLYNYFDGKEAIIAAIVERNVGEFMQFFDSVRQDPDVARLMIEKADEGVHRRSDADESTLQIEILAEASRNPKIALLVSSADDTVRSRLGELVEAACAQHGAEIDDLDARVELLLALFDGVMVRARANPSFDRPALARLMQASVAQLLCTPMPAMPAPSASAAPHA